MPVFKQIIFKPMSNMCMINHYDLVMPCVVIDLGQYWFKVITCHRISAKPIPERVQTCSSLSTNLSDSNQNWSIFCPENVFEKVICIMAAILFRPQCVNYECFDNNTRVDEFRSCLFLVFHNHKVQWLIYGNTAYTLYIITWMIIIWNWLQ